MKKIHTVFLILTLTLLVGCEPPIGPDNPPEDFLAPAEVTSLVVANGNQEITLNWVDPVDSDYVGVEISNPNITTVFVAKGIQTKKITGLINNTDYNFVIKTLDTKGNKSTGSMIATRPTDTTPPGEVSNLVATPSSGQIALTWNNPGDADFAGVKIYRKLTSENDSAYGPIPFVTISKTDSPNNSYTFAENNGENVTYKIKTFDIYTNESTGVTASAIAGTVVTNYTVSYNSNTGTGTITSQTVGAGGSITLSNGNGLSKTGHTFAGWKADNNGSVINGETSYTVNANVVMFAQWTKNTYKIIFHGNGSTSGSMSDQSIIFEGSTNINSNQFLKTGHTFAGWAISDVGDVIYANNVSYTMSGDADVNLYAKWTVNTYTLTFHKNDGGSTTTSQTLTYNVATALTANSFTRSGYDFAGWATSSGGIAAYSDGQNYTIDAANADLYAVWTIIPTTIDFYTLASGIIYKATGTGAWGSYNSNNAGTGVGLVKDGSDFYTLASGVIYKATGTGAWSIYNNNSLAAGVCLVKDGSDFYSIAGNQIYKATGTGAWSIYNSNIVTGNNLVKDGSDFYTLASGVIYKATGTGAWSIYNSNNAGTGVGLVKDGSDFYTLVSGVIYKATGTGAWSIYNSNNAGTGNCLTK